MLSQRELLQWVRAVEEQANAGPPVSMKVTKKAWRQYAVAGGVFCPEDRHFCNWGPCRVGTRCEIRANSKGLKPSGETLPHRERPTCEARTRACGECRMRVEPGKHRCRLHGGLSTGPKTAEGRERVRQAQLRRWAIVKSRGS